MAKKYTVVSPDGNVHTTTDPAYYQRLRAQGYEDKPEPARSRSSSGSSGGSSKVSSADTDQIEDS